MFTLERQDAILALLQTDRSKTVQSLAKHFYVSPATIRRDLDVLSNKGLLRRTYGGVVLLDSKASETPLLFRESENVQAKDLIASLAITLLANNSIIMIDSSSTALRLVKYLSAFEGITAITHGLKTALLLHQLPHTTVHCLGGRLQENTLSMVGASTCERIETLNADFAFLSCRGFSLEKGITEASEDEAQIKKQMIRSAQKTILLCDSSKIGNRFLFNVCPLDDLYALVTDKEPSEDLKLALKEKKVRLLYS